MNTCRLASLCTFLSLSCALLLPPRAQAAEAVPAPWVQASSWERQIASSPRDVCAYRSALYYLDQAFEAEIRAATQGAAATWVPAAQPASRWRVERDATLQALYEAWSAALPDDPNPVIERLQRFATADERRTELAALQVRFPGNTVVVSARLGQLLADGDTDTARTVALEAVADSHDVLVYRQVMNALSTAPALALEVNARWRDGNPASLELLVDHLRLAATIRPAPAGLVADLDLLFASLPTAPDAEIAAGGCCLLPLLCTDLGKADPLAGLECLTRLHEAIAAHPEIPDGAPWHANFVGLDRRTRRELAAALALAGRLPEVANLERQDDPMFRSEVANALRNANHCDAAVALLGAVSSPPEDPETAGFDLQTLSGCADVAGAAGLLPTRWQAAPDAALSRINLWPLAPPELALLAAELERRDTDASLALRVAVLTEGRRRQAFTDEDVAAAIELWIERAPTDPLPRWYRFQEALTAQDFAAAWQAFEAAAELAPADTDRLFEEVATYGRAATQAGRQDLAERAARTQLELARTPKQKAQAHGQLGHALNLQGRGEEALEHFRQYFPLLVEFEDPHRADTDFLKLLLQAGRIDELERYLDSAFRHLEERLAPAAPSPVGPAAKDPWTLRPSMKPDRDRYFGSALRRAGAPERALPYLRRALERSPDDAVQRGLLRQTLEELGRVEEAAEIDPDGLIWSLDGVEWSP